MSQIIKKHGHKLLIIFIWLLLVSGTWLYAQRTEITALEMVKTIIHFASSSVWGPIIYIMAYAIRPLTLLPSVLLSIAAGIIFGSFWGTIFAVLGSNASANLGYIVAYFLGKDFFNFEGNASMLNNYIQRMRESSFETVLTMRLLFLPYDSVSVAAGFLQISWRGFALATLVGGFAGTLSFVLFGASIEGDFIGQMPEFRPWTLLLAGTLFVLSITLSRIIRHFEKSV